MSSAPAVESPTNSEKYQIFSTELCLLTAFISFSDADWKKKLKIPAKDTRTKTEVSKGVYL